MHLHVLKTLACAAAIGGFGSASAYAQGNPRACGEERWPVKVGLDDDAARVDTAAVRTTVDALRRLPRPAVLPYRARAAAPELTTYRVIGVIRAVLPESDGDLHLVVDDIENPGHTMIAEVPDSACAVDSPYASRFAEARRNLQGAPTNAIAILEGIGFFDFPHGQRGIAPNAFELHPVTGLRVVGVAGQGVSSPSGQRARARPTPDSARGSARGSDVRVWVNAASNVYHCPGTRWYGTTRRGSYMTEREARAGGARSATGRPCGPTNTASPGGG